MACNRRSRWHGGSDTSGGDAGLSMSVIILANVLAMIMIGALWLRARGAPRPSPRPVAKGYAGSAIDDR